MCSGAPPSRSATTFTTPRSSRAVSAWAENGLPPKQHRRRVAHAALELAGEAVGLGLAAALGGLADQHLAVVAQQHHRRDLERAGAERGHLGAPVADDRRRRVRRPEVDPQLISHRVLPAVPARPVRLVGPGSPRPDGGTAGVRSPHLALHLQPHQLDRSRQVAGTPGKVVEDPRVIAAGRRPCDLAETCLAAVPASARHTLANARLRHRTSTPADGGRCCGPAPIPGAAPTAGTGGRGSRRGAPATPARRPPAAAGGPERGRTGRPPRSTRGCGRGAPAARSNPPTCGEHGAPQRHVRAVRSVRVGGDGARSPWSRALNQCSSRGASQRRAPVGPAQETGPPTPTTAGRARRPPGGQRPSPGGRGRRRR